MLLNNIRLARGPVSQRQRRRRHPRHPHRLKPHRLHKSRVAEPQIGAALLRRGRSEEFLESRIIPEWIEHRIQPEQGRSKRGVVSQWTCIRYRE
jgi:hypothetical protein